MFYMMRSWLIVQSRALFKSLSCQLWSEPEPCISRQSVSGRRSWITTMERSKNKPSNGLHSFKDIAAEVTDGFCELMDKTRSQMGELDPLEAHVNQREIFKKNLQSLKEATSYSEDSDSGVGVSSSGNHKQRPETQNNVNMTSPRSRINSKSAD